MSAVLMDLSQDVQRQKSEDWKDSTKRDAEQNLEAEIQKLLKTAAPHAAAAWKVEFAGFQQLFRRFLTAKPTVNWSKVGPPPDNAIVKYDSLPAVASGSAQALLQKLVVVKLNGGLGTSMGCKGPKSVISVRHDLTFLDLTLQQIEYLNLQYGVDVPLVLMNSFNTDEDTQKVLRKYRNIKVSVHTFNQSRYPRIDKETLMPIARSLDGDDQDVWYPPGHGNVYEAFNNCGLLDKFLKEGKQFCFLSNVDNLGATVDLNILNFLVSFGEGHEFLMEVTDKTRADIKGGTLIEYENRLMLLEIAQVPKDNVDEFKSVSKFKIFNTNNLWCSLRAMKNLAAAQALNMEVIVNPKHTDSGHDVIQLETAAGAAIKNFKGAVGLNVPRERFLPVKKTQDLLLVMSNLYELSNGSLMLSEKRSFQNTPLVKLGSNFDKVQDFLARFAGVPDILELDHLTVTGDVWFGKGVTLKGTVIIIASQDDRIDIPHGSVLENKIVSGNKLMRELEFGTPHAGFYAAA